MKTNNSSPNNIALDYVQDIYTNASLETKEPQPLYIIHKDSLKTFLYEQKEYFAFGDKLIGLLGIEASIIVALFTSNFKDFMNKNNEIFISGKTIQGIFICLAFIFGVWFLICFCQWIFVKRKKASIDSMCDEFEKKSSIMKPKIKSTSVDLD